MAFGCTDVKVIQRSAHKSRSNILGRDTVQLVVYIQLSSGLSRILLANLHSNMLVALNDRSVRGCNIIPFKYARLTANLDKATRSNMLHIQVFLELDTLNEKHLRCEPGRSHRGNTMQGFLLQPSQQLLESGTLIQEIVWAVTVEVGAVARTAEVD
ncbi:hypothetical protein GX50_04990 [[Emmonsia] crescens]|uniref:Uncharacterized protein n=1 Tax=[Emmonsia] crescens TaxID=73230 RepID=A0A2B7ZE02_9EURO|nr:hypothetical protein GX50_04990 [Emmonsia crescens]